MQYICKTLSDYYPLKEIVSTSRTWPVLEALYTEVEVEVVVVVVVVV